MFKRSTTHHLLAAIGLIVGQWLLFLHASQHQLNPADHTPCEICTIAHAVGTAPAIPTLPQLPAAESVFLPAATRAAAINTQLRLPPGHAPPFRFA